MCGIVGYVGPRDTLEVLLSGLKRLEYRGYDSAGVALVNGSAALAVEKAKGPLAELTRKFERWHPTATAGIGHTRWATHGVPSRPNAHPHASTGGSVAVVHNGIIENYIEVRDSLQAEGVSFSSQTDTEVIPHLIARHRRAGADFLAAFRQTIAELKGSWAIAAVSADAPHCVLAARRDSPLVLALGAGETFLASDVPAVLAYTRRVMYLQEGDVAALTPEGATVYDAAGQPRALEVHEIDWDVEQAEKGGEPHFMLKEIKEQPEVLQRTFAAHVQHGRIVFPELGLDDAELAGVKRVIVEACGTAYHAGMVAKYAIEEYARIPVDLWLASELRYAEPPIGPDTLVVAVSQSGETEDTKRALLMARERGATPIAVCNVRGASIPRECRGVIYTAAGLEIGVASTKAYTTQVMALLLLAFRLGRARGVLEDSALAELLAELGTVPRKARALLAPEVVADVRKIADHFTYAKNYMYLGRRYNLPTAYEGALKLKEISYIHAEGYGAGEMKHGPIALVENTFPVVAVIAEGRVTDKMISNLKEVEARNGMLVCVATEGLKPRLNGLAHFLIELPRTSEVFSPLLAAIPLQLLAYFVARNRGNDPDKPRNLAKAVTVE